MLRPALEEGASQSQIARTHQLSKSAVQPRSRFTPVPVALRSALPLALWSFHLENCDSHGLYKQTLPPLPLGPYPLFFSLRLSHKLISYCYHEVILLGPMRFCFKNIKQLCKKFVLFHLLINLELSVHQVTGNIIAAPSFEIVKRKEHEMTDCSQLPAELAAVQQQRDAFPKNPIQYCLDNTDNLQEYKACLRDQRSQTFYLDQQISILSEDIKFCNAIEGTWILHSTDSWTEGQQFTITTWDTQGSLTMTFTYNDGTPGFVEEGAEYTGPTQLLFGIDSRYIYSATFDRSTSPPQFVDGHIAGKTGTEQWIASKL